MSKTIVLNDKQVEIVKELVRNGISESERQINSRNYYWPDTRKEQEISKINEMEGVKDQLDPKESK